MSVDARNETSASVASICLYLCLYGWWWFRSFYIVASAIVNADAPTTYFDPQYITSSTEKHTLISGRYIPHWAKRINHLVSVSLICLVHLLQLPLQLLQLLLLPQLLSRLVIPTADASIAVNILIFHI